MVVEGEAERNFDRVEQNPDRVFIGGGGLEVIKAIPKIFDRLNRDGIIVAVAVTLKNLTNIINVLDANRIDYEAISLSFYKLQRGFEDGRASEGDFSDTG